MSPVAADTGWARGAGIFGLVSMVPIAIGVVGIIAADDEDVGTPIGIALTVYEAIAVPFVAWGGGSARGHPAVRGSPGMRAAGWVAYGLTLLDAVVLISVAASGGEVGPPLTATVGLLGECALLFFVLDAFSSASDAEEISRPVVHRPWVSPFAAFAPSELGGWSPMLGLRGTL